VRLSIILTVLRARMYGYRGVPRTLSFAAIEDRWAKTERAVNLRALLSDHRFIIALEFSCVYFVQLEKFPYSGMVPRVRLC